MSLLKIIANDTEIDFVKETLSIKTENNALSRDFKVSASNYPFLIIENDNTRKALGTRDIASIKKNKVIEVIVFEGGKKYYGELKILSYINGFRKCDLKYSSVILSIMNKKIAEFMPVVSVIPDELNPIPYSEKSPVPLEGSQHWKNYPVPFLDHNFPEVKWQFPTMKWLNKFGVDLEADDPWKAYRDHVNLYDENELVENYFTIVGDVCNVYNRNVPSPQIFILSPAFYALQSLGFTLSGNFINNEFIKRLLLYSNKNNLTETNVIKDTTEEILPMLFSVPVYDDEHNVIEILYYHGIKKYAAAFAGSYIFEYNIFEPYFEKAPDSDGRVAFNSFRIYLETDEVKDLYVHWTGDPEKNYKGTVRIDISSEQVGSMIVMEYYCAFEDLPVHSIFLSSNYAQIYNQMHPTIELGRYLPDWTFGTYLNELQNLFNLEINIDDFAKKITIDFNEDTIENSSTYVVNKSLEMTSYEQTPYNAFLLKFDNDEDSAIWITTEGNAEFGSQTSNFLETLRSKFKNVPTTYTANLSEALDSKSGTGIMIYDPSKKPYISADFLGQTLAMNGSKGIYNVFWKIFLKFLLNSSPVELNGPFTETEKNKIIQEKRIFVDNQEYMIASTECKETQQDNFIIKFDLRSINF